LINNTNFATIAHLWQRLLAFEQDSSALTRWLPVGLLTLYLAFVFDMDFYRSVIHHSCRRAPWHDYHDRSIYMVTLNRSSQLPPFSKIVGALNSHENPPRAQLLPLGEIVASNISALKQSFPFVKILRRVIMPEHIHIVIFITEKTGFALGDIIHRLKTECSKAYNRRDENGELITVFEKDYHDRILSKKGQLERILGYVSDNPRRRLERMTYKNVHHRYLIANDNGNIYEAYGNIQLLEDPDIEAVKVSRRDTPDGLKSKKQSWLKTMQNGGVIVSPFISPAERKVRDWAFDNYARVIYIEPNGFGDRYTPKEPLHSLCSEGRLLIIAPLEYRYDRNVITREECLRLNDLASDIASYNYRWLRSTRVARSC
jgi:REP element-mobilizing transposase RayT